MSAEPLIPTLGEYLRTNRENAGFSLRQVETMTGLSNAYISQLETGKVTNPTVATLRALARAVNVDLHALVDLAGRETDPDNDPRLRALAVQLRAHGGHLDDLYSTVDFLNDTYELPGSVGDITSQLSTLRQRVSALAVVVEAMSHGRHPEYMPRDWNAESFMQGMGDDA